jgi:putative polyketide hydroxylase
VSILFEADLRGAVADRQSAVYYLAAERGVRPRGYPMSVGNPPPDGVLLTVNGTDRWLLVVGAPDPDAEDGGLDMALARTLVRRAVGSDQLPVRVISLMAWTPAARVAQRYGTARTFLAGDAAHEMTPSGAFGLNTGIQDAHNLAWKLGALVRGDASPALLATYDAERRSAGTFNAETSYELFAGTRAPRPFGNWGVIFGAVYESAAIVPDGTPAPVPEDPVVDYRPIARPGHRAPHAWVRLANGRRASTIDLFGRGFVLLAASRHWPATAAAGSPLIRAVVLGEDASPEDPARFDERYGIGSGGAVLVRPDGYVCWRSANGPADPDEVLHALDTTLGMR